VWNAEAGSEINMQSGHTGDGGEACFHHQRRDRFHRGVTACAFSPDGRQMVSAARDGTLKLWDVKTGAETAALSGHEGHVTACAYSPDANRIVSGSDDSTLRVWNSQTGVQADTLVEGVDSVRTCAYSPDGRWVVANSSLGEADKLKVWDAETGKEIVTLAGVWSLVRACIYSPDGRRIIAASGDHIVFFDADTGEKAAIIYTPALETVQDCVWSPDGRRVVSASNKSLRVYNAQTQAQVATLERDVGRVLACAYLPDGSRIVSAYSDATISVWDTRNGGEITLFAETVVSAFALGAAGPYIAAGDNLGRVYLLHLLDIDLGVQIVTLVRLYRFDSGQWDAQPTAKCEWCGQRFAPVPVVLDAIASIARTANLSPDQSPCLALPAEAWDEPRLLSEYPHCHEPLKFNPFIVDNRDRIKAIEQAKEIEGQERKIESRVKKPRWKFWK
jgi:WD40 repeat protein